MLSKITSEVFSQLVAVLDQLSESEYSKKLEILNNCSVSQHVRHILEFYICLDDGITVGKVDYDKRKRNLALETDPVFASQVLKKLCLTFCTEEIEDTIIQHDIEFGGETIDSKSSVSRELVYLIEHTIHHFAIIDIALRSNFPEIVIPANFGVAYSTAKHKECELVAHAH
jgi:hypothetical protein